MSFIRDSSVWSGFDFGQMFPTTFIVSLLWHQIKGFVRSNYPITGHAKHDEGQIRGRLTDLSAAKAAL